MREQSRYTPEAKSAKAKATGSQSLEGDSSSMSPEYCISPYITLFNTFCSKLDGFRLLWEAALRCSEPRDHHEPSRKIDNFAASLAPISQRFLETLAQPKRVFTYQKKGAIDKELTSTTASLVGMGMAFDAAREL